MSNLSHLQRATCGLLLFAALCFQGSACSLLMRGVDSERPAPVAPLCTQSKAAAILDLGIAGSSGTLAGAVAEAGNGNNIGAALFAMTLVAVALPYGISSLVGFARAASCREDHEKWKEWRKQPLEQRLADSRAFRRQEVMATAKQSTGTTVSKSGSTLVLQGAKSEDCLDLRWTTRLRGETASLQAEGITQVTCKVEAFEVWSGPLSELPHSVQETRCGQRIAEALQERDMGRLNLLAKQVEPACSYGVTKVIEWYGQAVAAALSDRCEQVLAFEEQIRQIDETFVRNVFSQNPDIKRCTKTAESGM